MSVNSSSSNRSLLPQCHSFHNSSIPEPEDCRITTSGSIIFTSFSITTILLLLPLCIFILHHGLQQWRQRKRSTSSAVMVSHCDCFTYHLVVTELVRACGCVFNCCGVFMKDVTMLNKGEFLFVFAWFGENFFHILTCVERYLAVVHPITYLGLRNQRGIRIRNISITCVWLLCFAGMGSKMLCYYYLFIDLFTVLLSLTIVSFCSLSVLCVLIRPGPGEQDGGRERVDQSKKKALYMTMSILGVLVLRFIGGVIWTLPYFLGPKFDCVTVVFTLWLNLPSILVLPLLFLYRAGKFVCCKNIQ